ncbi:motility protein A [Chromohalobacter nigrandesensis]|uniref:motility protein A n=1 Tax=Chromohalobacter nigrandesensis TaxID=119863 RepID=UPI001FF626B2|nr:MotA/TolQ/ExbB proton channel family protein [Chromohalobacter nigrandesensis]MCK0743866.1 MotA/TolQ/ExbB proton channel family protein [Chromohalobacter nigrandesensis]
MNPSTLIGIAASVLLLTTVVLFTAQTPSSFFNFPGLAIVITGTLAATFISYPMREVVRVSRLVGLVFHRENSRIDDDIQTLVSMARHWFRGNIRAIEDELEDTRNPFLRTGVSLVIANTQDDEIHDVLRWRIARMRAREYAESQIFRTMATYAPAFGMLGTLIGLINMLEVIDGGDLTVIGPRLAIALMSTFYGILLANLFFKPIAVKLERRTEERLIEMHMVMEGVMLIAKRRLPSFVEDTLNSFMAEHQDEIRDASPRTSKQSREEETVA